MFGARVTDSLTDEKRNAAQTAGVIVPPAALDVLFNCMQHVWYELTDNPNDPLLNKPEKSFLPGERPDLTAVNEVTGTRREGKVRNALAFSHCTTSRAEFEQTRCHYQAVPGLGKLMDGIVFDQRTTDAFKDCDPHFHCEDGGNVIAVFMMPKGWVKAFRQNQVCQRCGRFPALVRCYKCNGSSFCSDDCLLRANHDGTHSADVCEYLVHKKVEAVTPIRQEKAVK